MDVRKVKAKCLNVYTETPCWLLRCLFCIHLSVLSYFGFERCFLRASSRVSTHTVVAFICYLLISLVAQLKVLYYDCK